MDLDKVPYFRFMVTVKIKRSSIKKNPNAFSQSTRVPGQIECTFSIKDKLPGGCEEGKDFLLQSSTFNAISGCEYEGYLLNIDKQDAFIKAGAIVICQQYWKEYTHAPEPEYLYEY